MIDRLRNYKTSQSRRVFGRPPPGQGTWPVKTSQADRVLRWLFIILVTLGLILLSSASSVVSYQQTGGIYGIVWHQLLAGVLPGVTVAWFLYRTDYRRLQKYFRFFFIATVALLLLVFVPGLGKSVNNSRSWVGVLGITFQPSEIAKLTFIIFLAGWFIQIGWERLRDWWAGFFPFILYVSFVALLLAGQPDLGTLVVFAAVAALMFWLAGGRARHLIGLTATGLVILWFFANQFYHVRQRLAVFFNPSLDPHDIGYHISQSLIAIGSGGWFGRGYGKSHQKFAYLPEVTGDSIFAIIGEEFGFFGVTVLLGLFLAVGYYGFQLARQAPDPFGRFLAGGITTWLVFQAFFNIAVMTGLAPLTGIPLPFISRGGTAMLASLAAAGILLNISRENNSLSQR